MSELLKVESITGHIVFVDKQDFENRRTTAGKIWGQESPKNESGWYFDIDGLTPID